MNIKKSMQQALAPYKSMIMVDGKLGFDITTGYRYTDDYKKANEFYQLIVAPIPVFTMKPHILFGAVNLETQKQQFVMYENTVIVPYQLINTMAKLIVEVFEEEPFLTHRQILRDFTGNAYGQLESEELADLEVMESPEIDVPLEYKGKYEIILDTLLHERVLRKEHSKLFEKNTDTYLEKMKNEKGLLDYLYNWNKDFASLEEKILVGEQIEKVFGVSLKGESSCKKD